MREKRSVKCVLLLLVFALAAGISGCGTLKTGGPAVPESTETPAALVAAEPVTKEEESQMIRIFCFGDSNTYGYDPGNFGERYDTDKCWTGILQDFFGDRCEILNEGLNGRTTGIGSYMWEDDPRSGLAVLEERLSEDLPVDIAVIMLGTNDCFQPTVGSAEEIRDGMAELVRVTRDFTLAKQGYEPQILLVSPAALKIVDRNLDPETEYARYVTEAVARSEALAGLYKDLAERTGCAFLDAGGSELVSDLDGVHLTEEGHRILAEKLAEKLSEMTRDAG